MTRLRGFIGGAYTLQSVNIDCQRCVNLFPQITESQLQADGETGALISTPGLRLLGVCGSGPIRGMFVTSTGGFAIVSGSEVYRVGYNWTFTKAGDLLTNSGPVSMADNGLQLMIVDGKHGYIVSLSTGTLTQITSEAFPGADTVAFQDGYFICNNPGTGQFFWSNLYDGFGWDALNFITAEGSPDATVAVLSHQRQVWTFGAKTVEVWWNAGSDSTFARIDGAYIEYGCIAPATAQKFTNSVIWVGGGPQGQGVVWQAIGFQPKRISNHGVELAIQSYGDISKATAWIYQENGHAFYVLNFPGAPTSWVYDISTGQWHERAYLGLDGNFERHRAECYAYGFGTHVVGDYANGNIYALENVTYTDNGRAKKWLRRAPHLSANGRRLFFSKLQLMAQVGYGLDGNPLVWDLTYTPHPTVNAAMTGSNLTFTAPLPVNAEHVNITNVSRVDGTGTHAVTYTLSGATATLTPWTHTRTAVAPRTVDSTHLQLTSGDGADLTAATLTNLFRTDWQGRVQLSPSARTNLISSSDNLQDASWVKTLCTAPSASRFQETAATGLHFMDSAITANDADTTYLTFRISQSSTRNAYIRFRGKAISDSGVGINLSTGAVLVNSGAAGVSVTPCSLGGWYVKMQINWGTGTTNGTPKVHFRSYLPGGNHFDTYLGVITEGIDFDHVMTTTTPGVHIPTTTAPVTLTDYTLSGATITLAQSGGTYDGTWSYSGGMESGESVIWSGTYDTKTMVEVGTDPQVELRYSDDFAHTWTAPRAQSLGKIGEYAKRVIWRQLGQSRQRVFEVSGSDPVAITIQGAELDAAPGVN